jgi:hypothetical protein
MMHRSVLAIAIAKRQLAFFGLMSAPASCLASDRKLSPEILVQQTNTFSLPLILLEKWLTRVKSLRIQ